MWGIIDVEDALDWTVKFSQWTHAKRLWTSEDLSELVNRENSLILKLAKGA